MNRKTVWAIRIVLALPFLFAGGMKWVMPAAVLAKETPLPVWFIRFIGAAEISGAIGLMISRLTRPAAVCLSVMMVGATGVTLISGGGAGVLLPMAVGCLALLIATNDGGGQRRSAPRTFELPRAA